MPNNFQTMLSKADRGPQNRGSGGLKGVQSLHNMTSQLAAQSEEHMTRIVSERTVCYCSNFDLDAAEWFRSYHQLKMFSLNLHNRFGKLAFFHWNETLTLEINISRHCEQCHNLYKNCLILSFSFNFD